MKESSINSHIPEDIISDIMLQLPMKTLLRCKSVCKLWYKIIDDPKLVYMPSKKIKKSSEDNFVLRTDPLVSPMESGYMPFFDLDKSSDDTLYLTKSNNVPRICPSNHHRTPVGGSCNGLICLKANEKFEIMNPLYSITDTYEVDVPYPYSSIPAGYAGFGFDEVNHKFKIVCFAGRIHSGSPDYRSVRILVHEVGVPSTSSWRELSKPVGCWSVWFLKNQSSVFTSGCIHWLADILNPEDRTMYGSIVSFNLTTEEFVIDRSCVRGMVMKTYGFPRLFDFNGSLGVVDVRENGQNWEYGQHELITKISVLCRDADNVTEDNNEETTKKWINKFCIELPWGYSGIVGILQARHILMMDKCGGYFSYNTHTGVSTQVPELTSEIWVLPHQGSLIRPSSLASFCNSVRN